MRRYYIIIDHEPVGNPPAKFEWNSHPDGVHADPNAQQVEFQLFTQSPSNLIGDSSTLTVYGVSWAQISEQALLIGKGIKIYGGMGPGLPLATEQSWHYGLLAEGNILKCWGNWIGTDMSLGVSIVGAGTKIDQSNGDGGSSNGASSNSGSAPPTASEESIQTRVRFNRTGARSIDYRATRQGVQTSANSGLGNFGGFGGLVPSNFGAGSTNIGGVISSLFGGAGGLVYPLNFIHNLMPNMPLSGAIQETLSKVFPGANINVNISSALKLGYQDAGMYQNFPQYAAFIKKLSHSILGTSGYLGINMVTNGNTINVFDASGTIHSITSISVYDLIGQPTWIEQGQVQITMVMRGDLKEGDYIRLPPNVIIGVSPNSGASTQRTHLSFAGVFLILKIHHSGDFRNPDGVQWVSIYECLDISADTLTTQAVSETIDQSNTTQNPVENPIQHPVSPGGPLPPLPPIQQQHFSLTNRPVRRKPPYAR